MSLRAERNLYLYGVLHKKTKFSFFFLNVHDQFLKKKMDKTWKIPYTPYTLTNSIPYSTVHNKSGAVHSVRYCTYSGHPVHYQLDLELRPDLWGYLHCPYHKHLHRFLWSWYLNYVLLKYIHICILIAYTIFILPIIGCNVSYRARSHVLIHILNFSDFAYFSMLILWILTMRCINISRAGEPEPLGAF